MAFAGGRSDVRGENGNPALVPGGEREPDSSPAPVADALLGGSSSPLPKPGKPTRPSVRGSGSSDHPEPTPAEIFARLASSAGTTLPCDDRIARDYPTLWHFLTVRQGEAADGRNGTSITLVCEGSAYTVIVSLKSCGKTASIPLYTLQGFLGALDEALRDHRTVWREMKDWKRKPAPKEKKEKGGGE